MSVAKHTETIIELDSISFSYGSTRVLKDITLAIHRGDYLGVIGPNGSGKTTLLRVMLGLACPSSGVVRLFGEPLEKFRRGAAVGYVPQRTKSFDPYFPATVFEVVAMGRYAARGPGKMLNAEDRLYIERSLEQVEMAEHRNRLIGDLSGGQQQRVFIARALAGNPEVLVLDEPTVGVDMKAQEEFYLLLKHLNQEKGLTLILVSHDIDAVANETTEIACINQTLVYHGDPRHIVESGALAKLYGENVRFIPHDHR